MNIDEIKSIKRDIEALRGFDEKVNELAKNSNCDKLGYGFNYDSRFKGTGNMTIWFGGYKGFYGDSGVVSVFDIVNEKAFEKCFVEALNELRPVLFKTIADKLQRSIENESQVIMDKIGELTKLYEEIKKG